MATSALPPPRRPGSAAATVAPRPKTVVMIVDPPGEPSASHGRRLRMTIVGATELRGRLPPWTRSGCVRELKLKSRQLVVEQEAVGGNDEAGSASDSIVNV